MRIIASAFIYMSEFKASFHCEGASKSESGSHHKAPWKSVQFFYRWVPLIHLLLMFIDMIADILIFVNTLNDYSQTIITHSWGIYLCTVLTPSTKDNNLAHHTERATSAWKPPNIISIAQKQRKCLFSFYQKSIVFSYGTSHLEDFSNRMYYEDTKKEWVQCTK